MARTRSTQAAGEPDAFDALANEIGEEDARPSPAPIPVPQSADPADDEFVRPAGPRPAPPRQRRTPVRKGQVKVEPLIITEEMEPFIERRLRLPGGTTVTEIGADLANRFPVANMTRQEQVSRYVSGFDAWILEAYGDKRETKDGVLLGYGDRIKFDSRTGHLRMLW